VHNICVGNRFVARSGDKAKDFGEILVANQTFRMIRGAKQNSTITNNYVVDLKQRARDGDASVRQQFQAAGIDPDAFAALPGHRRPATFQVHHKVPLEWGGRIKQMTSRSFVIRTTASSQANRQSVGAA
jgi:hypothetical protein